MESETTQLDPPSQLAVSGGRSLCRLLVRNDHKRIHQLLEISPDLINTRHPLGWAPFHTAILNCDAELLKFILSLPGLDVSVKDQSAFNSSSSDADILCRKEELCPKIVGTEATAGASALHFACMRGDAAVLGLLVGSEKLDISKGFDWQDESKSVPREYFDLESVDMEAVRLYREATVQSRARFRLLEKKDTTALCSAICKRDVEYCKEIIDANKSLATAGSTDIYTRISSIIGSLKPASMDLRSIMPINWSDDDDNDDESTVLHLACLVGEMTVVELILQAGADWGIKDDNYMLPEDYGKVHGDVRVEDFRKLWVEEKERRDKREQMRKAEEEKEKEAEEKEAKRKLDEQLEIFVCMGEFVEYLQDEREQAMEGLSDEEAKKRAERASTAQKRCNRAERKQAAEAKKEEERKKIAEAKHRMRHLDIEKVIGADVVGQRGPIRTVASAIRLRENGWVDPERPLVLMFLGSSGVGKTEIAKRLALYLHNDALKSMAGDKAENRSYEDSEYESGDDSDVDGSDGLYRWKDRTKEDKKEKKVTLRDIEKAGSFVRIDMSEYQQEHTVSNLTGSPKGYVGYEDGGSLTKKLKKNPRAVVLFDEIEKAHPDVLTVFLQLFDDGRITDSMHGTIHCPNAVFIMTSNLGSAEIRKAAPSLLKLIESTEAVSMHTEYLDGIAKFNKTLYPVLKRTLKRDEFLGRINQMVVFLPFTEKEIKKIVRIELNNWKKRAQEHHDIRLSWTPKVIAKLAQGYDVNYGARSISNEVKSHAIQILAESQIRGDIEKSCRVRLVINDSGSIDIRREDAQVAAPASGDISAKKISEGSRDPVANEAKSCAIQEIAESQIRGDNKKRGINDTGSIDLPTEDLQVAAPISEVNDKDAAVQESQLPLATPDDAVIQISHIDEQRDLIPVARLKYISSSMCGLDENDTREMYLKGTRPRPQCLLEFEESASTETRNDITEFLQIVFSIMSPIHMITLDVTKYVMRRFTDDFPEGVFIDVRTTVSEMYLEGLKELMPGSSLEHLTAEDVINGKALDAEISLLREVLNTKSSFSNVFDQTTLMHHLGLGLAMRYKRDRTTEDLDEAFSLLRRTLDLRPSPHPVRPMSIFSLADLFFLQSRTTGQIELMDEAINLYRDGLKLCPPSSLAHSTLLQGLAHALWARAQSNGARHDLDEAILLFRQCVDLFSVNVITRYMTIENYVVALGCRFELLRKEGDLVDGVFWAVQCVEYFERVQYHKRHRIMTELVTLLADLHQQGHQGVVLDGAISLQRKVLKLEGHQQVECLKNLGTLLTQRFLVGHDINDLDESITLFRTALSLPQSSDRYSVLGNFAVTLSRRFACNGDKGDFEEAVKLCREAISLLLAKNQNLIILYTMLAQIYCAAYSKLDEKELLEEGMNAFSVALQIPSISPNHGLLVAQSWAVAADKHHHPTVLRAYDTLLQVARECASLSLNLESRQQFLIAGSASILGKAAPCAIRLHDYGKAIEYLEAGRAVVWSQVQHLRAPLDRLLEEAPELGGRLREISKELQVASHRNTFAELTDNKRKNFLEHQERQLEALTAEWHSLIDQVRGIKGFEDFLQPPRLSVLRSASTKGPVVFLIPDNEESHCLIMTGTDIHHMPLPALPEIELFKMKYLLQAAAAQETLLRSSIEHLPGNLPFLHENMVAEPDVADERATRRAGALRSDDVFKHILKILWDGLVKPVLGVLGIKASAERPTIQWCPTDLFTFLPIHAAGNYDTKEGLGSISDYVISTYTPTIERLLASNDRSTPESFRMLAVVDTNRLLCASEELYKIKARVPNDHLVQLGASKESPSHVETILSHLSTATIVHFACHGTQDRAKPLDSGLLVDDGLLTISKIMQQPMLNGSLAILCACETAMGDEKLPDEAVSLGASLLFSGFRSVIATMWSIQDRDGPIFADAFYEELFKGSDGQSMDYPDVSKSIRAFDFAVQKLRSQGAAFRHWVPFVHLGQ